MPPPIEYADLTERAVLWTFARHNRKGDQQIAAPVQVCVRWEEGNFETADAEGNIIRVDVVLACDRQIAVNSLMWEGSLKQLKAQYGPTLTPTRDIYEVVTRNRGKSLQGEFTRYEFGLRRYKDALPEVVG